MNTFLPPVLCKFIVLANVPTKLHKCGEKNLYSHVIYFALHSDQIYYCYSLYVIRGICTAAGGERSPDLSADEGKTGLHSADRGAKEAH